MGRVQMRFGMAVAWVVVPGGDHAAFLESSRRYFIASVDAFLRRGVR